MGSMPQYYSNDSTPQQNNREPPHLLSSSFIQSELNSPTQHFSNMSENGYQTTADQFEIHSHSSSLGQPSAPMSEPPPYDEFVEYNWPTEISTNFGPPPDEYNHQQLFNPEDTQFFFNDFLGNLDENDNFMFNPSLPMNMPIYPNPPSDNNDSSPSHHLNSPIVDNVYNILPGQVSSSPTSTADLLNQNQFPPSNSTTLSPRTSKITLSSSPPLPPSNNLNNNNNNDGDDDSSSEGKDDGSSTPTVPSKRKQENDDERNRRRTSIPRLTPINTKLAMTQSNNNNNNNNNASRPMSPPMQLSNLSINNNNNNNSNNNTNHNNHNHNHNNNNYDDSPGSSSNNNSPSPRTPNREIINPKNDDDELITSTTPTNNLSNIDDQNDEFSPTEIKTEEPSSTSTKQTPQKSSRKPYKELLTEEEKRANHIASEQKRRNTIRAGFKELTDIIPTLKNVNNSKSTILFKAVDYIKYLERRNRNLKERAGLLEMRVEMEMRQGKRFHHHHHPHGNPFGPTTMGFGHQRVAPMPINYGVMPNGGLAAIPIGHHPTPTQQPHVMPHHQIYFVPTQSTENPPSMIPAGSVVSPVVNSTNNIFSRGAAVSMQIPALPLSSQQNHHLSQQDNVPGMNIPTMGSDDDGNSGSVDIDGDSSMIGLNGNNATRVGAKC